MDPRFLLPDLPPELRNLLYYHTISDANPATNSGFPFKTKTYDSSHITVTIMPVHHGNPSLLALSKYGFQEAKEYYSWLLFTAIELRVSVLFKGREETFVQEHWEQKISQSIKKLARKYSWFSKVTVYDIQIVWDPIAWTQSRRRRNLGSIANSMIEILTRGMDEGLAKRSGTVKAGLHVRDWVAREYVDGTYTLGLKDFVSLPREISSIRRQVRDIRILPVSDKTIKHGHTKEHILSSALRSPSVRCGEEILSEKKGVVNWGLLTKGMSIIRGESDAGMTERIE